MKQFTILITAAMAISLSVFAAEKKASDGAIQLNFVSVASVAGILNEAMPECAAAVTSVDEKTNTIVLDATDPNYEKVRKLLSELDQRPKQILHSAVFSEVTGTGVNRSEKILSGQIVTSLEGRATSFFLKVDGREFKLTVSSEEVKETPPKPASN